MSARRSINVNASIGGVPVEPTRNRPAEVPFWNPRMDNLELVRRLREQVSVSGSVMALHDAGGNGDIYAVPRNAPWVLSCGPDLTVYFGAAVTGTGGDTENVAILELVYGSIPRAVCDEIAPALGEVLQAKMLAAQ